jgi:IS6 family transposase
LRELTGTVALTFGKLVLNRAGDKDAKKTAIQTTSFSSIDHFVAVRIYLRYPLSYQDVADLLGERGVDVDRTTVFRWVQKFGPELAKRTEGHLSRASLNWHVDETYIRVGGKWRYLWRAIDADGQLVDFRLTARRDAKAAKAFLNKATEPTAVHRV